MRDGKPHEARRNDAPARDEREVTAKGFRNKLPRPAGQGASRQVRGLVGVSGSQTGGQGIINIAQSELVSGTLAGTSWPNNIPASGKQTQYALNVPYRSN